MPYNDVCNVLCTTLYQKFLFIFQLWKELIIEVVKEADDIHQKQQQSREAPPHSNVNTQRLLGHLSFPFIQFTPSDVFQLHMQPSYSHITETDYDAQNKVQGIYGTQFHMHSKQATSTVMKSSTYSRKSSGGLDEATTTTTSLQNLFKLVGGGGAKPVKVPFLPRYSPTNFDDCDKLLGIGDKNIDNISEDYSLDENSLFMPDETQHKEEAENCCHQKDILSKP